jgi:hypothetical protein
MQMVIVTAFLLVNCLPAMAQSNTKVKGVITSGADGLPLIGVNVVEKGTTNGTVTDFDGNFELTVSSNAVLDISYIGFLSQEVKIVAGKTTYNVVLKEDSQALEEVVVVGYGVQKKKLVTGATVQVSGDNLQKLSTTNVLGALQSQSPGVNITQSSGQPGESFKVVIRGLGTVGSAGPLYVIDGVAGGDINALNPSDIEAIDVLKDAASRALAFSLRVVRMFSSFFIISSFRSFQKRYFVRSESISTYAIFMFVVPVAATGAAVCVDSPLFPAHCTNITAITTAKNPLRMYLVFLINFLYHLS